MTMQDIFAATNADSPFTPGLLEQTDEGRRALFGALRPDFLRTNQQQALFRQMFDTVFQDFETGAARDILANKTPSTFVDFLQNRKLGREARRSGIGGLQRSPISAPANFLFDR